MTVITSASQLCTLPIQGICQGGQPVMSFNFGAGKKPRVKEAFRFQLTLCFGYTTLFWLLMMLVPGVVAGIFTSDAALIEYTTWAMRIYMAGILAMGVQIACQQSFMALGQAKVSLLLACLRKIILLIPLIFILPHFVARQVLRRLSGRAGQRYSGSDHYSHHLLFPLRQDTGQGRREGMISQEITSHPDGHCLAAGWICERQSGTG